MKKIISSILILIIVTCAVVGQVRFNPSSAKFASIGKPAQINFVQAEVVNLDNLTAKEKRGLRYALKQINEGKKADERLTLQEFSDSLIKGLAKQYLTQKRAEQASKEDSKNLIEAYENASDATKTQIQNLLGISP